MNQNAALGYIFQSMPGDCFATARPAVNKAAFVLTDGSDRSSLLLREKLNIARAAGIEDMVAVGFGPWVNTAQLLDIGV